MNICKIGKTHIIQCHNQILASRMYIYIYIDMLIYLYKKNKTNIFITRINIQSRWHTLPLQRKLLYTTCVYTLLISACVCIGNILSQTTSLLLIYS